MNFTVLTLLLVAVTPFLQSCATAKAIVGPDGSTNQLITCSSIELCYEKATEVCGGKYNIVHTSSEVSGSEGNTYTSLKLLVKCDK